MGTGAEGRSVVSVKAMVVWAKQLGIASAHEQRSGKNFTTAVLILSALRVSGAPKQGPAVVR